jgi:signal transduction histidine kinase
VRRRLEVRLALALCAVAVLVTAVAGFGAVRLSGAAVDRRVDLALDRRLQAIDEAPALLERRIAAGLERLGEHLERKEPELLTRLFVGGPEVAGSAVRLLPLTGLDQLDLIDGDGRLISSTHRVEGAGLIVDPGTLPAGEAIFRRLGTGSGERLLLRAGRGVEVGEHRLLLIGGTILGEEFLSEMAAGESAAFLDGRGVLLQSTGGASFDGGGPANALAAGEAAGFLRTAGATYGGRALVSDAGSGSTWIVVSVDRTERKLLRERLIRLFLLVGVAAGLLAGLAGLLIARGSSRPVDELVRAVDAIGAGEADYTFTRQVEDEFQELISAFSRLHRSLEFQQQRSRAAERVAAWREVARHVAHEVKNPLVPIRLTVENLLRARERHPERFEEMLDEGAATILEEVDRLRRMVGEFSEFARMPIPERRPVDPAALIEETLRLYAAEPGLEIVRLVEPGLPTIEVDEDQISRALKNVVGNAVEAMRSDAAKPGRTKRLELRAASTGEWVTIEIADSGAGFSVEAAERIFEPYYTTKSEGSGIGMWITYRIITEHGGVIAAENRTEGGARVVLRLPVTRAIR